MGRPDRSRPESTSDSGIVPPPAVGNLELMKVCGSLIPNHPFAVETVRKFQAKFHTDFFSGAWEKGCTLSHTPLGEGGGWGDALSGKF